MKAQFSVDSDRKRAYLESLFRYGHKDKAARKARELTGDAKLNMGTILQWRVHDQEFAQVERQVHSDYWDDYADEWQLELREGRKLTSGEANIVMQQLNRHKAAEYLPAIQIQQHQTVSYQPQGGFREEPEPAEEPVEVPVPPAQTVN